ncbi:hypothetical protein ACET3Z_013803 [Daucus carota]
MDEATYVIPQVSELAMDLIEEVKKIKGKEKIYADKAFDDNGVFKVEEDVLEVVFRGSLNYSLSEQIRKESVARNGKSKLVINNSKEVRVIQW